MTYFQNNKNGDFRLNLKHPAKPDLNATLNYIMSQLIKMPRWGQKNVDKDLTTREKMRFQLD